MKRFLLSSASICASVLLSGCTSPLPSSASPQLDKAFSAEAQITVGDLSCEAQMRRLGKDRWEFCLTAPYPLEGLIVTLDGGKTELKLYDISSSADVSSDAVSTAKQICEAFEAAIGSGGALVSDGTNYSLPGQCAYGTYIISFAKDMTPSRLELSERGIKTDISKFTEIEREEPSEDAYITE